MKTKLLLLHILFLISYGSFSQGIGIGTTAPDASAALDITTGSKGLLIPRMSTTGINSIVNPAAGLMAYDSVTNQLMVNMGTPGAPNWQTIVFRSGWNLAGNTGINPANQFIGNTDNQPLRFRVNNIRAGELNPVTGNAFWGLRAGQTNTTGFSNVAIGIDALKLNTERSNLVAIGDSALFHNGDGAAFATNSIFNTAVGSKALFSNTLGSHNTAIGAQALTNSGGGSNTAVGSQSLLGNTGGTGNTATGAQSLLGNTSGSNNVAIGFLSLPLNTTGSSNTSTGVQSLRLNTTGEQNSAYGSGSLFSNTTGIFNTAIGGSALSDNTFGSRNTAVGLSALRRTTGSQFNTAVGFNAADGFDMGFNNTIIGANADINQPGLFNCVALGESALCTGSSQVRLGNSSTVSIGGIVGYTNLSDGRYKKNMTNAVKGIDFIMKLRPVMYQLDIQALNKKLYPGRTTDELSKNAVAMNENEKTIFSGFVAQEVEQAAKDANYDFSGLDKPKNESDLYGLRYSEFVVPMVKAMQEQQQMIQEQQQMIQEQRRLMEELKRQNTDLLKRVLALEKK